MNFKFANNFISLKENEKDIYFKSTIKIIFQQSFLLISFILFLLFSILGFDDTQNSIPFKLLSTESILYRSLFILFLGWFLFFSFWSIKTGLDFFVNDKKKIGLINIFSFIPISSVYLILFFVSKINKDNINYYKVLLFEQDDWILEKYKWKSWRRILVLILFLILLPVVAFVFIADGTDYVNLHKNNIWFYSFHYFTNQTNLMVFFFTTVLLFFPGLRIFKTNTLQTVVMSYILVVGVIWNALLFPPDLKSGAAYAWSHYQWASTIFFHIINPIAFTIVSLILIFKSPFKNVYKLSSIMKLGFPYIFIYYLYIVVTPFTSGIAVYEIANTNPDLMINDKYGGGIAWAYIVGVLLIFALLFSLFCFLENKINSKKVVMAKN